MQYTYDYSALTANLELNTINLYMVDILPKAGY